MPDRLFLRLDDQLCFALYAATNAVTRAYRPRLEAIGLTYPQYLVMLVLWQDGASPVRHIAARLNLPPNGITPILDKLDSAGFVTRERGEGDRRVVTVAPTETGAALEQAAAVEQDGVVCATGLVPEDLDRMRGELRAMVVHMEGALATQPEPRDAPANDDPAPTPPRSEASP